MNAFLSLFGILLGLQFHAQIVSATVTASLKTATTWNGGGQYMVNFKNNDGSKTVCSVKFSLTPKSGSWQKRIGFSTINRPDRYVLVKDHDEETLKLGLTDYSRSDYFDKEFYQRIKTANIDFGPPKRPW